MLESLRFLKNILNIQLYIEKPTKNLTKKTETRKSNSRQNFDQIDYSGVTQVVPMTSEDIIGRHRKPSYVR